MCPSLLVLVSIEARARYWLSDNRVIGRPGLVDAGAG